MSGLNVGTQPIRFSPSQPGTLVNLGTANVYIDTVQPNQASTFLAPLGGVSVDGSQTYWLVAASGVQEVTFLPGMTAYLPSSIQISEIVGNSQVSVTNSPIVLPPMSGGVIGSSGSIPGFDTSNFDSVFLQASASVPSAIQVSFSSPVIGGGSISLGGQALTFQTSGLGSELTAGIFDCLGSTLNLGSSAGGSLWVVGFSGKRKMPVIPTIDVAGNTLPASGAVTLYPRLFTPGKFRLWCYVGQASFANIEVWSGSTWIQTYQQAVPASTDVTFEFAAPWDDWRVKITNQTATATSTFFCAVTGPYE